MDREKIITEYLHQANASPLENSKLVELRCGEPVENAEWVDLDKIGERTTVGYPIYFDEKEKKVLLTHNLCHSFVVSSTGKGKTTVVLENKVDLFSRYADEKRPSLVITDPKGELAPLLIPQIQDKYEILIMNLKDPAAGNVRVNPLTDAFKSHRKMRELEKLRHKVDATGNEQTWMDIGDQIEYHLDNIEKTLMSFAYSCNPYEPNAKEQCWSQGARSLILGGCKVGLYESEDPENEIDETRYNPALISDILTSTQNDYDNLIEYFKKHADDPDVKKALATPLSICAKQTRDSYVSTSHTGLSKWSSAALRRLTARNTLDFDELAQGKKPFVLFIIADDTEKDKDELLKFTIERLLRALQAEADKQPDGRLSRETVFLLDEFCNFPCMSQVAQAVTISRSRGIYFVFVAQSFQQMIDRYGENVTNTVVDNCNIQICLGSNSYSSKKRFADEFGRKPHNKQCVNVSADGSYSRTITTEEVPVLKVSDIDRLSLGEFYLRFQGLGFKSYMTPYFLRNDVNHVRQVLPRLNRCIEDYLPRPAYDIEKSLERDRAKRRWGYGRLDNFYGRIRDDAPKDYGDDQTDADDFLEDDDNIFKDSASDVALGGKETPNKDDPLSSFDDLFERLIKNAK